jgi:hypothetical protein
MITRICLFYAAKLEKLGYCSNFFQFRPLLSFELKKDSQQQSMFVITWSVHRAFIWETVLSSADLKLALGALIRFAQAIPVMTFMDRDY